MNVHEDIRKNVSEAYTRAVEQGTGCCGPKGFAAKTAGYGSEAAAVPDAYADSFGCGNPLAFSEVRLGDTVVDLGSGAGLDLLLAAEKVGPSGHVIGVDMTDAMIDRARANATRAGATQVEVRKGHIEDLPVEAGSVDWVISNCVINLSPDKPRVFSEIARVLRSGGRMLVSDLVAEDLPSWVAETPELYASCIGGATSEAAYLRGLRNAGLVDVEVRSRKVYGAEEVGGLIASEVPDGARATGCCGSWAVEVAARELAGKVRSISVFARKP
jgi:SAM-dependent methyltransferase